MTRAREVAHEIFDASGDWMYPCPENSHLPPCDRLTAAIEARDAEHATEATRLRDQLRVARELLGKSQRFISAAREYLLAAIASLETP